MLQIKTILKNTFRLSASYFFILPLLPYKLSEETTQCKHAHYTIFLTNNNLSSPTKQTNLSLNHNNLTQAKNLILVHLKKMISEN